MPSCVLHKARHCGMNRREHKRSTLTLTEGRRESKSPERFDPCRLNSGDNMCLLECTQAGQFPPEETMHMLENPNLSLTCKQSNGER